MLVTRLFTLALLPVLCSCVCILQSECDITSNSFYHYAGVGSPQEGDSYLQIENSADLSQLHIGDKLFIMQMQGGYGISLDTNPASTTFGDVLDYGTAGVYETNFIDAIDFNCDYPMIQLHTPLTNSYLTNTQSSFQVVKIIYCETVTLLEDIVCKGWDGARGGVVIIQAFTLNMGSFGVDCSGAGYRGGSVTNGCVGSLPNLSQGCLDPLGGAKGETLIKNTAYPYCLSAFATGGGGGVCNTTELSASNYVGAGAGGSNLGILAFLTFLFPTITISNARNRIWRRFIWNRFTRCASNCRG